MGSARPDGGWGWVVAAGALLVGVIVDGIKYSFGLLFIEFLDTFRASKSDTSWIMSIQVGMSYLTGPVTGALVNRFGCRKIAIAGTLISFAGFVISPFATSLYYLYISFGVLGGFGFGMVMLPFCVTVVRYFDKYLAFATGISAMGPGLGTIIFNPLTKVLIDRYTWRGTLLVEAGLVLNCLVCAVILRQPEPEQQTHHVDSDQTGDLLLEIDERKTRLDKNVDVAAIDDMSHECYDVKVKLEDGKRSDERLGDSMVELQEYQYRGSQTNLNKSYKPDADSSSNDPSQGERWLTCGPMKNSGFVLLMLSTVLIELSLIVPFSYLPDMMKNDGYSPLQAVWIISVIGISSTVSRVIAGAVGDLKCVNRVIFCIICIISTGLTIGFFPLCSEYESFIVLGIAFGISAGSSCTLRGILIPELFGVDTIADCVGISMFFSGAAAFISLPLAGFITDVSGHYNLSFIVAGIEMVVGGGLICIILCLKDRTIKRK